MIFAVRTIQHTAVIDKQFQSAALPDGEDPLVLIQGGIQYNEIIILIQLCLYLLDGSQAFCGGRNDFIAGEIGLT